MNIVHNCIKNEFKKFRIKFKSDLHILTVYVMEPDLGNPCKFEIEK